MAPHLRRLMHDRRDPRPEFSVVTNVFSFVGTHRDDPDCLLLLGDDGPFYSCDAFDDLPTLVEPDDDWVFVAVSEVNEVSQPRESQA